MNLRLYGREEYYRMADKSQSNRMNTLIIIAVLVLIVVVAYAIYHYSGWMKMFSPYEAQYTKELVK